MFAYSPLVNRFTTTLYDRLRKGTHRFRSGLRSSGDVIRTFVGSSGPIIAAMSQKRVDGCRFRNLPAQGHLMSPASRFQEAVPRSVS